MPNLSENQQASPTCDVEVTPEMIRAGLNVLLKCFRYEQGRIPDLASVYQAMEAARLENVAPSDPEAQSTERC